MEDDLREAVHDTLLGVRIVGERVPDVEIVISSLMRIEGRISRRMYDYSVLLGNTE